MQMKSYAKGIGRPHLLRPIAITLCLGLGGMNGVYAACGTGSMGTCSAYETACKMSGQNCGVKGKCDCDTNTHSPTGEVCSYDGCVSSTTSTSTKSFTKSSTNKNLSTPQHVKKQ